MFTKSLLFPHTTPAARKQKIQCLCYYGTYVLNKRQNINKLMKWFQVRTENVAYVNLKTGSFSTEKRKSFWKEMFSAAQDPAVSWHIGLLERRGAPGGISCLEKDFPTSPWSFKLCSLTQWGYKLGDLFEFFIKRLNGSYSQVNFLEHCYTYELLLENESKEILWNSVKKKQEIRQYLKEFNVVDYFCLHKFKV